MRYRIFDINGYVGSYSDRQEFSDHFKGTDPNHPVPGIIRIKDKDYIIFDSKESCDESKRENEFHEIDNQWFTNLLVKLSNRKDETPYERDVKIRSYLNPIR